MYWFIFSILTIFLSWYGEYRPNVDKRLSILSRSLLIVLLSYVISSTAQISADQPSYVDYYNSLYGLRIGDLDMYLFRSGTYSYEYGYTILSIIGNWLGLAFPGFHFLVLLFINWVYVSFAYKHKFPVLSIFFFILSLTYLQQANLFRQSIAIAIFIYSLKYLYSKKWFYYLAFVLLASLFHNSAILLIPLVVFCFFDIDIINIDRFKIGLGIALVTSLFLFLLKFDLGLSRISFISGLEAYEDYVIYYKKTTSFDITLNFVSLFAILNIRKETSWYYAIFVIGTIIDNLAYSMPAILRFVLFFIFLEPLLYTEIFGGKAYNKVLRGVNSIVGVLLILNAIRVVLYNHIFFDGADVGTKIYAISEFFRDSI